MLHHKVASLRKALPASLSAALLTVGLSAPVHAQEIKVGIVSFLSGQAADSFGVPAVNGAKSLIEAFNNGSAPAPYNKKGFGGLNIVPVYVDENGGATKQVTELRNLYDREGVDMVIGYVSSGDCLAVSPVAEEMKRLLVLYDCGSPRIFEEASYKYVFRTASHGAMDNVAAARYLKAKGYKVNTINLINQDYAWGHDSIKDFTLSMAVLYPNAKTQADQRPKFGAGQYGTEISALMAIEVGKNRIEALGDRMLTDANVAGELAYLDRAYSGGFERPYGWAWALALHAEMLLHDAPWARHADAFAGAFADRVGAGRVLFIGVVLVAIGTFITPFMTSGVGLAITLGVLSAAGSGAASFSVLIGAAAQRLPAEARGTASGVINAGGSFGQFVFAPIIQKLIQSLGWMGAMWTTALLTLAALPLVGKLTASTHATQTHPEPDTGLRQALREVSDALVAIRAAHHPGFDRVVFQFQGGLPELAALLPATVFPRAST